MSERCPICGETAPEPAELCLRRVANIAKFGEPCDYSQEGWKRFASDVGEERASRIDTLLGGPQGSKT